MGGARCALEWWRVGKEEEIVVACQAAAAGSPPGGAALLLPNKLLPVSSLSSSHLILAKKFPFLC